MTEFVHLHNHTEYSVLDGATRISDLVNKTKEFNMGAVAITDHGTMFGCAQFYLDATKAGIKPIIGMEAYLSPKSRFDKNTAGMRDSYYHLILLAKDYQGYRNLMELSSRGYIEGFYYKPRIDKELLKQYSKGLICSSACLKGEIAQTILKGKTDQAKPIIEEYSSFFDKGDFYLEIMDHGIPEQDFVNRKIIELSREMNIPLIATNDAHYLRNEDAYVHDVLLCVQTGCTQNEPNRLRFQTNEFYVKSPDQMAQLFANYPQALKNTMEIAEKCNLKIDFTQKLLPHYHAPENYTSDKYLDYLCGEGLKKRYKSLDNNILDRLKYELAMIKQMGFVDYFLVVWDFIHYAKEKGIPVGPGRGSAAGSIVAYLLGITDIDPLKYDLIFERFLNPERVSMPDIDIDFCYERRSEVINYVTQKYGKDNVAQIATFGTLGAKAVVRDVGRVMGMEYNEVDKIAKLIPNEIKITLEKAVEANPELKSLYQTNDRIKTLINTAYALEGNVRNTSTHAAGIVISEQPLTNYVPLCTGNNGEVSTQYSMKIIEKLGLLKMDFLGLKTLTVIDQAIKIIKKTQGVEINLQELPIDDKKTYDLLCEGNSIGLFQLESSGMREILTKLKPTCFEDIIALVALYRPGPLGSGMVDDFISRKHGRTKITYELPELEPILKDTYGVILYQEQVQKIASVLAGFTLGDADLLRRAMGKKIKEEMDRQRERFVKGAVENKVNKGLAESIFDKMAKFAEYGFNKSHSAAYALIAYQTAYLKANYPVEFMAALLSSEMTNPDKITLYIEESKKNGIKILPPDVNQSFSTFTVIDANIRFGLNAVKNVGVNAVEAIISARKEKGQFTTLFDFARKTDPRQVNRKVIESLVKCGAFDSLGFKRSQLFNIIDTVIERANSAHQDELAGQFNLFGTEEDSNNLIPDQVELPDIEEWNQSQMLQFEKELLGFYITGHPLDQYRKIFDIFSFNRVCDLKELKTGSCVKVAGILTKLKITVTRKNNEQMAITYIEDYTDGMDVLVYPRTFSACRDNVIADNIVLISGQVDLNEETPKIIAEEIIPLKDVYSRKISAVQLELEADKLDDNKVSRLKEIIERYKGACAVYMKIKYPDNCYALLQAGNNFSVFPGESFLDDLKSIIDTSAVTMKL